MEMLWTALAAFFGALVSPALVEWYRQRNRLRLAAVDQRLATHQEAFALCRRLMVASERCDSYVKRKPKRELSTKEKEEQQEIHDNMCKIIRECREWFDTHCLYLDIKSRLAFKTAYEAAWDGYIIPPGASDPTVVSIFFSRTVQTPSEDQKKRIENACDAIAKAAGLPPLTTATDKLLGIQHPALTRGDEVEEEGE